MTRVLIVDDKEENLYYLEALLKGNGCLVESARHGAEALVKARHTPPDLIISDLLMPVMDGYTLLRHWKVDARLKAIPFIVYTATYTEAEDERLALNLGADAFILKPAEPEDFLVRIREVLANVAAAVPVLPKHPIGDEKDLLKVYSETLIRKLEEKSLQLEDANQALQRDIANRKMAEISLRESEQRFRQLAENINEVFWITDPAKRQMLYVSPAYEKIWGRTCQELYAEPASWLDAIHPDDRERIAQAAATQQLRGDYDEVYRIVRPDGSLRWIRDRAFPVANEQGEAYRIVGTAEDITERKHSEERLAEQAALLDAAHDAILVEDLEGRVVYWNKGAQRTYGWTAAEALGRPLQELIYKDAVQFTRAKETLLRHGDWSGELRHVTKHGGEVAIEGRWTLLRDARGTPKSVLSINNDITERKKLEAQFLRAQRMESIGTLAGGIAHDLNNVLAPILMSVEMLKYLAPGEEALTVLNTLQASAQRGAELVKQVLSFARGVEGQRVRVNPIHLMRELLKVLRDTFPKSIEVSFTPARGLWTATGDPTQLHQVFLNLCVNARDAMPQGGSLAITMENAVLDETYAAMNPESKAGAYVVVKVADTGTGIPQEIRERIFEPFFTTKEVGKGTGLGLSTTLAIVRSHHGFIHLYSEPGKGTTFNIYLPADTTEGATDQVTVDQSSLPRGHGELILVVDDEAAIRKIAQQTLERFGYRVVVAGNGAEAVSIYAQHQHEIEVVLTDMAMPIMDGHALTKALTAMNPQVQIIGSSGLSMNEGVAKVVGAGVQHFVPKPYTAVTLLKKLKEVIAPDDMR